MALAALMEAAGSTVPWAAAVGLGDLVRRALGVRWCSASSSLWVRWRHATGATRQQVKWLALAASVFGIELALGFTLALMHAMSEDPLAYIGNVIFVLTVCLIPAAMGIGIVRHHLYDVDKLLSRTIAYGLLLVAALLLYLASVAVFAGRARQPKPFSGRARRRDHRSRPSSH